MIYLIFSGEEYEAQGGMADLRYAAMTDEKLLDWARGNLPMPPHQWIDIIGIIEGRTYDIDEDELVKGQVVRSGERTFKRGGK